MITRIKIDPRTRIGPLTWDFKSGRYWDRTSDLFGVKAASSQYGVSGSGAAYVITWTYVSGWTAWCWRLLEGLFPLCSFSDQLINVGWLLPCQSRGL